MNRNASVYDRDLIGYANQPPRVAWPGGAKLALQFVINYEEGGEHCLLHGDAQSEAFLSEIVGAEHWSNQRHPNMESIYEYGSRAGFWRLHRLFTQYELPVTVFGVAMALERNPNAVDAMLAANWEIASHGYRWIDYRQVPPEVEKQHLQQALAIHQRLTGDAPAGWYIGRTSENTRRLLLQTTQPLYDADSYADDLPYWFTPPSDWGITTDQSHLIVPYTLDANDMRFATCQGFNTGDHFYRYLKDSFDVLYDEGDTTPKMMSVGLHCRLAGRPGRLAGLKRFLHHVLAHPDVWVCQRQQIAHHWRQHHFHHHP